MPSLSYIFSTIEEALTYYFSLIIKLHKKYRLTMAAWESEILASLDYYLNLRKKMNLEDEFSDEMYLFINEIEQVIKRFPEEKLNFEGKEKQIFIITQAIIHKYTYDNYGFNSDEELINLLVKIILTILRD